MGCANSVFAGIGVIFAIVVILFGLLFTIGAANNLVADRFAHRGNRQRIAEKQEVFELNREFYEALLHGELQEHIYRITKDSTLIYYYEILPIERWYKFYWLSETEHNALLHFFEQQNVLILLGETVYIQFNQNLSITYNHDILTRASGVWGHTEALGDGWAIIISGGWGMFWGHNVLRGGIFMLGIGVLLLIAIMFTLYRQHKHNKRRQCHIPEEPPTDKEIISHYFYPSED